MDLLRVHHHGSSTIRIVLLLVLPVLLVLSSSGLTTTILLLLPLVLLLIVLNRAVELRRTRIGHRRNVSFVVFTTDNEAALAGNEPLRAF